jgi:hypothetical protein
MAFTDNCDVFASFHEDGVNRVINHVRRQRPSLFNYATAVIARDPRRLCEPIQAHPIVGIRNNPLATIVDLLPIPGTDFGLDFCVQLSDLRIDFHPGDEFALPPELNPLPAQRLAIRLRVCIGLACPPNDIVDQLISPPTTRPKEERQDRENPRALRPVPFRELRCFCLDAFVTGGVRIRTYSGRPYLEPFLSGFEIVDIKPDGLEAALECYVKLILSLVVLPGLRTLLEATELDIIKNKVKVVVTPMPTSAMLPNNPAIENDQLKAFAKIEVI